ncbi:MAG: HIT domain-containing protein [Gemmataceae bacterium]
MAMMAHNLFLKIISKEIPAKIAHEDEHCLAFHDINPQAPVHVLIIPKKVIRTHADLAPEDAAVMGHIHLVAVKLANDLGLTAGYRLAAFTQRRGQAVGQAARPFGEIEAGIVNVDEQVARSDAKRGCNANELVRPRNHFAAFDLGQSDIGDFG